MDFEERLEREIRETEVKHIIDKPGAPDYKAATKSLHLLIREISRHPDTVTQALFTTYFDIYDEMKEKKTLTTKVVVSHYPSDRIRPGLTLIELTRTRCIIASNQLW